MQPVLPQSGFVLDKTLMGCNKPYSVAKQQTTHKLTVLQSTGASMVLSWSAMLVPSAIECVVRMLLQGTSVLTQLGIAIVFGSMAAVLNTQQYFADPCIWCCFQDQFWRELVFQTCLFSGVRFAGSWCLSRFSLKTKKSDLEIQSDLTRGKPFEIDNSYSHISGALVLYSSHPLVQQNSIDSISAGLPFSGPAACMRIVKNRLSTLLFDPVWL